MTPAAAAVPGSARASGRAGATAAGAGVAAGSGLADGGAATAHSGAATSSSSGTKLGTNGTVYFHEPRSTDSTSHRLVSEMQKRMDDALGEEEAVWTPSVRVKVKTGVHRGERNVFGMQTPDGEVHIVRSNSSCTLNLAYDYSGDGCVKPIKIIKTGAEGCMDYYIVYPSDKAIQEAEQEADGVIFIADADGNQKSYQQVGRKTLRDKANHWAGVALHHAGDILHMSSESGAMNLGNIVGTVAWVTKETLERPSTKLTRAAVTALVASLTALGITPAKAAALAAVPIFLGCNFGERKPASTGEDNGDADSDGTGEEPEDDESVRVIRAKPADARALRSAANAANKLSREKVGGGDGGLDSV